MLKIVVGEALAGLKKTSNLVSANVKWI